jgi:hypothetical protein
VTTRPRLLYLGHTLPFPPDRGAALRSYHVLRELAGRYEVDALLFRHHGDPTRMPLDDRIRHLKQFGRIEAFRIPQEWNGLRLGLDRARSLLTRRSEARWQYDDRTYRRRVLELAFQRDPRIIHVDSMVLYSHLPLLTGRTVVVAHARPESEHLRQRAELSTGLSSSYLEWQADWMEKVEREWLGRVSANIVASEEDRSALLERAPRARVRVLPGAVDTRYYTPAGGTGHGLAFVGGATGPASRDALEYFAGEILPRLRRASGVQALEPISWVGNAREGDRERYRERGIDITGYVEDIRPIVRPAACYIVPRRKAGGGTRILQAWAMGKAVVSTSVGCHGLAVSDGVNILIRDDPDSFAQAVLAVLEDRGLRRRLGDEARKTVETQYSWERRGQELIELYRELEGASPLRDHDVG